MAYNAAIEGMAIGPCRRILRNGGVARRDGGGLRHRPRPAVGRLQGARAAARPARLLVGMHHGLHRQGARHVRRVLPQPARSDQRRPAPAGHRPPHCRHLDRAGALPGGSRAARAAAAGGHGLCACDDLLCGHAAADRLRQSALCRLGRRTARPAHRPAGARAGRCRHVRGDGAPSAAGAGGARGPLRAPPARARRRAARLRSALCAQSGRGRSRVRILRAAERRHRAQAGRGDAVLPRQPRPAHVAPEPQPVQRAPGGRPDPCRAPRREARGAVPRPRPLQERQRHPRPPDRRRAAAAGRPALSRLPARERYRGAAGRGRVHRDDASGARRAGGGHLRAEADRRAVQPVHRRGPRAVHHLQHRREHVPRRCGRRRHPAQERRHRHVPRQGPGQEHLPVLLPRGDGGDLRAPDAGDQPAAGAGARGVRAALPAHRRPAQPAGDVDGDPGALAASRLRHGVARPSSSRSPRKPA